MRRTRKAIYYPSFRKNIIRKAPIQSGIKHLCTSCAQNDAQCAGTSLWSPHGEVQSTKEKAINALCIKSVPRFIEPFLLTILNLSYCACEEPFIVLSTTVL